MRVWFNLKCVLSSGRFSRVRVILNLPIYHWRVGLTSLRPSTTFSTEMLLDLPQEVVVEVLNWVDCDSLLACRTVSLKVRRCLPGVWLSSSGL
jgi:hypothetical protein